MLKAWSLSLSVAVWVLERANKAELALPPVLDHLLLSEEEIEQRIGDFLQLIEIATTGDDVSDAWLWRIHVPGRDPWR